MQIPLGGPAGQHSYPQTISGDAKGGVAVKAGHAHENGSSTIGHGDHGRRRSTKPKSLKIPAKVMEEPEGNDELICRRRSGAGGNWAVVKGNRVVASKARPAGALGNMMEGERAQKGIQAPKKRSNAADDDKGTTRMKQRNLKSEVL